MCPNNKTELRVLEMDGKKLSPYIKRQQRLMGKIQPVSQKIKMKVTLLHNKIAV